MSFLRDVVIDFPTILRRTSPIPIGRTPGFFSSGTSVHERKDFMSRPVTLSHFFVTFAIFATAFDKLIEQSNFLIATIDATC